MYNDMEWLILALWGCFFSSEIKDIVLGQEVILSVMY